MKARELAAKLMEHPDFEVKACESHIDDSSYGFAVDSFKVNGIGDIGYSDGVIILSLEGE
jgi:hypothetical protein